MDRLDKCTYTNISGQYDNHTLAKSVVRLVEVI
jgi:hypothetical protein